MAKDWTKIQKKYKGMWVALAEDEETVLGAGKTARDALREAEKKGVKKPILNRMPETLTAFIGAQ